MGAPVKFTTRLHEWAADHFDFVQYPNIRPADKRTADAAVGLRWKYQMPLYSRIFIAVMSMITIVVSFGMLAALLALLYFIIV